MPISRKEKLMNWKFFWFILHLLLLTFNSNLALSHGVLILQNFGGLGVFTKISGETDSVTSGDLF